MRVDRLRSFFLAHHRDLVMALRGRSQSVREEESGCHYLNRSFKYGNKNFFISVPSLPPPPLSKKVWCGKVLELDAQFHDVLCEHGEIKWHARVVVQQEACVARAIRALLHHGPLHLGQDITAEKEEKIKKGFLESEIHSHFAHSLSLYLTLILWWCRNSRPSTLY